MLWFVSFLLALQAKFYIPDSAIDVCIKFLYAFFRILHRLTGSTLMEEFMKQFPPSLHILHKCVSLDTFTRFVESVARYIDMRTASLQLDHTNLVKIAPELITLIIPSLCDGNLVEISFSNLLNTYLERNFYILLKYMPTRVYNIVCVLFL